jgi:hypothetical protein
MSMDAQAWLEEVAQSCTSTLAVLNRKAEKTKEITEGDQVMSEICMGYLYLLYRANEEGLLEIVEPIGTVLKDTLH